jgi:integrase
MGRLTAVALKAKVAAVAKCPPGKAVRIMDGEGLSLLLPEPPKPKPGEAPRPQEQGAWTFRYTFAGKRRDMGLGAFPAIGLGEARALASDARTKLRAGIDPQAERAQEKAKLKAAAAADRTFKAVAAACIAAKAPGWRNAKHAAQWDMTLTRHVFPVLGKLPVADVTTEHVLRVLQPLWTRTPETASRVRGRIENVLDYARARKLRCGDNPARWRGNLSELLPSPNKVRAVVHQPALPWAEVPAFLAALEAHRGMAPLALRFAILTAARTGEVRGMTWGEVDLAAAVWTVPGKRMKAGRLHRVPLSSAAITVLEAVRIGQPVPSDLVFPSPVRRRDGAVPLSDMALSMLVRGLAYDGLMDGELPRWRDAEGRAVVPHGFRSTFRVWAGETRPEGREIIEAALAHSAQNKVEAAYARTDLLERRRPLMEAWGSFCSYLPDANVIPLGSVRACGGNSDDVRV